MSVQVWHSADARMIDTLVTRLREAPGVTAATGVLRADLAHQPRSGEETYATLLIGDCAALGQYAQLPRCADGDAFAARTETDDPSQRLPAAGTPARITHSEDGTDWRVPAVLTDVPAVAAPDGTRAPALLLTPRAAGLDGLGALHAQAFAKLDPADPDAIERVRNIALDVHPAFVADELTAYRTDRTFDQIRRGILIGVVALLAPGSRAAGDDAGAAAGTAAAAGRAGRLRDPAAHPGRLTALADRDPDAARARPGGAHRRAARRRPAAAGAQPVRLDCGRGGTDDPAERAWCCWSPRGLPRLGSAALLAGRLRTESVLRRSARAAADWGRRRWRRRPARGRQPSGATPRPARRQLWRASTRAWRASAASPESRRRLLQVVEVTAELLAGLLAVGVESVTRTRPTGAGPGMSTSSRCRRRS